MVGGIIEAVEKRLTLLFLWQQHFMDLFFIITKMYQIIEVTGMLLLHIANHFKRSKMN